MSTKWIGVDLDGTLATHESGDGVSSIGEPIPAMVNRVKDWLIEGRRVKILTARVSYPDAPEQIAMIQEWCLKHVGVVLDVTCVKDGSMIELWDDRCVRVERNTGRRLSPSHVDEGHSDDVMWLRRYANSLLDRLAEIEQPRVIADWRERLEAGKDL